MASANKHASTLAILGDGSVGKSSIINAFKTNGFLPVYKQTVGCDFYEKILNVRGDTDVSLRVWDIGGQSIHSKNLTQYISNATAIFLVYDMTNAESFENMNDWLGNVKKYSACTLIYLVGNKNDLINMRAVAPEKHQQFIEDNRLAGGLFVSAKTGENIVKSFYKIAGESIGIRLTASELGFYDTVVAANISKLSGEDESRTAFADEIERQDMEAMKKQQQQQEGLLCSLGNCVIA
jgi:Ras-related protein Rab-28